MALSKVLLTTSDYLPQLGGLTSFTLNIEKCLKDLGISYELFHWKTQKKPQYSFNDYELILNVHYLGGYFHKETHSHGRVVNFIHGSEILFESPNPLKKFVKHLLKTPQLSYLQNSFQNIFISNCTLDKIKSKGYKGSILRDVIFHNCINVEAAEYIDLSLDVDVLTACCVARDVPHKNLDGVMEFCDHLVKVSGKKIQLYLTSEKKSNNPNLQIFNISNISNEKRDEIYKKSHLNFLMSLDHSYRGFYEGFGLSILEGNIFGCPGIVFNSGGLPENVHNGFNGFLVSEVSETSVSDIWDDLHLNYSKIRKNTFEHVTKHHSLGQYRNLLQLLSKNNTKGGA